MPKLLSAKAMGPAPICVGEHDILDVILMKGAPRPSTAMSVLASRLYARMVKAFDPYAMLHTAAEQHGKS